MTKGYCYLYLTCEDTREAAKITDKLLEKGLIVCAKQIQIKAKYWWKNQIVDGEEILLIMESALDLFDKVEEEISKLHSYDTFVLEAVPIAAVSTKAKNWMEENIHG